MLETALSHMKGVKQSRPEWSDDFCALSNEALIHLGKWDELRDATCVEQADTTATSQLFFSDVLCQLRFATDPGRTLADLVPALQIQIADEMRASVMDSYRRSYEHVLKLHLLHEVGLILNIDQKNPDDTKKLLEDRLAVASMAKNAQESIISLRRVVLQDICANKAIPGDLMAAHQLALQSAKLSRKLKLFSTAYSHLLGCSKEDLSYCVEYVKLLWDRGDRTKAIAELNQIAELNHSAQGDDEVKRGKVCLYHFSSFLEL